VGFVGNLIVGQGVNCREAQEREVEGVFFALTVFAFFALSALSFDSPRSSTFSLNRYPLLFIKQAYFLLTPLKVWHT
jgi:hypothetical protein